MVEQYIVENPTEFEWDAGGGGIRKPGWKAHGGFKTDPDKAFSAPVPLRFLDGNWKITSVTFEEIEKAIEVGDKVRVVDIWNSKATVIGVGKGHAAIQHSDESIGLWELHELEKVDE